MPKYLSAKYYQENKERLQGKVVERYQNLSKEEKENSNNLSKDEKISWLSIRKNIIK